ncbi:hypothetical protein [Micromonospora maritima]|uniref:hypothetical protein n=1 Tax=Micromonospora maritima TaxID=986711 RepID=UPI00157DC316|nr:hypothetical protein [Micromonospora maritima]
MRAKSIRPGQTVGGQKVKTRIPGMRYGVPTVTIVFVDGTRRTFEEWDEVPVGGYVEPLPAGNVQSKHQRVPGKPRYSDGKWAGEVGGFSVRTGGREITVGKFNARKVDITAGNRGYDLPGRRQWERAEGPARLR